MSYTVPSGTHTITAQDKRALTHAESWFWQLRNGDHTLVAHIPGHRSATGFEQRHEIACVGSLIQYDSDACSSGTGEPCEYTAWHGDYWRDELRTFLADLSVGSVIGLKWIMGNNNDNMREMAWRRDELHATVTNARGKSRSYLIAVQVGPVNSASMIRRDR